MLPAQTLLSEFNLSSRLSPARDQGPRGTCVAFAVTALHEACRLAETGNLLSLSEEVLYWGAKQADRNSNPGTSFRSASLALGKWGQSEQNSWPYDPLRNDRDVGYVPPPEAIDAIYCHRGRLTSIVMDVAAIKNSLTNGVPVAVLVQMSMGFFTAQGGHVPMPKLHELLAENHAILITGYEDHQQKFHFRNSWGLNWGREGNGTMGYEYLTNYGKACCSLQALP